MYHRTAESFSNIWDISVNPDRFEAHLKVLKKMGNVIPLPELINQISAKKLQGNAISITFDDGYVDNYTIAKPLLEKYNLPATFFISSGNIGTNSEFWWDELEQIILYTAFLPSVFCMNIGSCEINIELEQEAILTDELKKRNSLWKVSSENPPSIRAKLFYAIWQQLRILTQFEQKQYLSQIRLWANISAAPRSAFRTMTINEIKDLASVDLFTIGVHTVTHPALTYLNNELQKSEILENRNHLEIIASSNVNLLSYPYGNYNEETIMIISQANFTAAFTTEGKIINKHSSIYRLPRFQVSDVSGLQLKRNINNWICNQVL